MEEAAAITPPDMSSGRLFSIHNICHKLVECIRSTVEQMKEVLDSCDVDYDENAMTVSTIPPSLDDEFPTNEMHQYNVCGNSTSTSDTDTVIERTMHREYSDLFLHCIASIPYFAIGTQQGLSSPSVEQLQVFTGRVVKALCMVPRTDNVVLIVDNKIEVHKLNDKFGKAKAIDVLPIPGEMCDTCLFECIGATDGKIPHYVITDTGNQCIHLWSTKSRVWCQPIDMKTLTTSPRNSFKMCVYLERIYITIYKTGAVYCLTLDGNILWTNSEVSVKPNGIAADHSGVYVCDGEGGNHCINLYGHDGTLINSILGDALQRPWSVAVYGRILAVLERSYHRDMDSPPMAVSIFQMHKWPQVSKHSN